jgi:hypothetical protein
MTNILKGVIAGTIFGIASIIPMLFIQIKDKEKAMGASFFNRFAIGFIIFNMEIGVAGWLKGGLTGLILSLPAAIISGKYPPIIVLGVIGGIICGLLV